MQKLDQKWPFLVRFGLNLGLNNLKIDQEAIFNRINSIGSTQLDRLQKWLCGRILSCLDLNLVRFGLNLGLNSLKFDQEAISNRIDSIRSTQLDRLDRIDFKNGFLVKF
jgi:hypothetical protein